MPSCRLLCLPLFVFSCGTAQPPVVLSPVDSSVQPSRRVPVAPECTAQEVNLPRFMLPGGTSSFRSALWTVLGTLRCCVPESERGSLTIQFVRENSEVSRGSLPPEQGFSPVTEHCLQVMLSHWTLPAGPVSDVVSPPRYDLAATQRAAALRLTVNLD